MGLPRNWRGVPTFKQTFLESVYQWIGYLVAGISGAILTLIFQNASP